MALPTFKPYFTTRGGGTTARIQRVADQTMAEDARRRTWSDKSRYFKSSHVACQKIQEWTSDTALRTSLEKYKIRISREEKAENLTRRRQALKELLEQEREDYERELKNKTSGVEYATGLKNRAEELRTAREQRRKELAHQKLLDHWKLNCPELREVRSRQNQRETCEEWSHQMMDRQRERDARVIEEQRYHKEAERQRLGELKRQEREEIKKKQEREELTVQLKRQMDEVRAKEEEAVLIEHQQALLMKEQNELYQAEEERRKLEAEQKKVEFSRVLARQAKAKLRRRCQQVQEALEFDLKILGELAEREREEQALVTERREKEKRDAVFMKRVMEEQLELEKQREMELDLLYQEEAARMWERREEEWEREKKARESLMAEVMAERQHQLEERMGRLKLQQEETIEQREKLLREIEVANQLTARENREKENMERVRRRDLQQQIDDRRRQQEEERLQQEWEAEQERLAEEEYDLMVQEEIEQVTSRPQYERPHPHDHVTHRPYSGHSSRYAWY